MNQSNRTLVLLICTMLVGLTLIDIPVLGDMVTKFDTQDSVTLSYNVGGGTKTTNIIVPNSSSSKSSVLDISGKPSTVNGDDYPTDVMVDIGNDGDNEWVFDKTGYGSLGRQDRMDNDNTTVNFTFANKLSDTIDIKLPTDAVVTGSSMDFKGLAKNGTRTNSSTYVQVNGTKTRSDSIPNVPMGSNIEPVNASVELKDIFSLIETEDVTQDTMNSFSPNDVYGTIYVGQSFKINKKDPITQKGILTRIDVYTSIILNPDDGLYLELYNTTPTNSYPTGTNISYATVIKNNVIDNGYTSFVFQNPPSLDISKNYAFILKSPNTLIINGNYQLAHDDSGTSNANSKYNDAKCWELLSFNGGSSWSKYVDSDLRFKTYVKAANPLAGNDFSNITIDFNLYDNNNGDNLSFDFSLPTYANNEWAFTVQNANPFDIIFNLSARTAFKEFPNTIELDIGDDGTLEWVHNSMVKTDVATPSMNTPLNDALSNLNSVTDEYGTDITTIPIRINTTGNGTLQVKFIEIEYDLVVHIFDFGSEIDDYIQAHNDGNDVVSVPIAIRSSSSGKITLSQLNYTYDGAPIVAQLIPLDLKIDEDSANMKLLDLDPYFTDDYDTDLDYNVLNWSPIDSVIVSITDGRWLAVDTVNATNGTNWNGFVNINGIEAIDDNGFSVNTGSFILEVRSINDRPIIETIAPDSAVVGGGGYYYDVNATDPEGDTLIYSLIEHPPKMSIDRDMGLISWDPTFDDIGIHNVTVDVFDGFDSVNQSFQVQVTSNNHAPHITSIPSNEAWVGQEYRYEIEAIDPDPYDNLVFSLDPIHPWSMELDGVILTWVPGQTQLDNNTVIIHVSDGLANITQEWNIFVEMNNPPEFTSNPPLKSKVGDVYTYKPTATDDDQDQLVFNILEKPLNMTKDTDGTLRWSPRDGDDKYTWLVVIEVTDGKAFVKQTYNITVEPKNHHNPPPTDNNTTNPFDLMSILPYLLIIIIVVVIIAIVASRHKKKGEGTPTEEEGEWPDMHDDGSEVVITPAKTEAEDVEAGTGTIVEDVFLVFKDGRLISHKARRLAPDMDSDVMSGMFTAIQNFIKESFAKEDGGTLKSFEYGDKKILMSHSEHIYLAMVISGKEIKGVRRKMKAILGEIEHKFEDKLSDWNGRLDSLKGIDKPLKALVAMTISEKHRALESELVNLLGDVEFQKGFILVKVALINGAASVITDAEVKFIYDKDALRIDHIHPDLPQDGSEIYLGNLGPDEKKTVDFYLDPFICLKSNVDATVTFKDSKGTLRTKKMEQLKVEVICPVLYTDEEINVAMLKRLIGDLSVHDSKIFSIPDGLNPVRAMEIGKDLIGNYNAKSVREFIEKDPFTAEVWSYGKTKFTQKPVVIRLTVKEETNTIEFFVATEELAALTGLLAEFGHEFATSLRNEGISETVDYITDPVTRDRILRQTELLIQRHVDSEEAESEIDPSDTD